MEVEIVNAKSGKSFAKLTDLKPGTTIGSIKEQLHKIKHVGVDRQSLRSEARGRVLKDNETLQSTGITNGGQLFYKDLGPQIAWKTVFLVEYSGPLLVYPIFYLRPALIYGAKAASEPKDLAVHLALACWSFHYAKRLLETLFVHRFSHATMPIRNIFKNSAYYWGFTAFVSYYVNHPLYTAPHFGQAQIALGLGMFVIYELGNLSIHWALRNLRPEGTKERRIPKPTGNPFTKLFALVSCPNYTYEAGSWLGFTIMTQTVPGLLFTIAGFYQMAVWAIGKHKAYKKEFRDYPKGRKAIVPFVL